MLYDKILSRSNLSKRSWQGSLHCDIYGAHEESTLYIFLHCSISKGIWEFLLDDATNLLNNINISEIFSLYSAFKFNISQQGWNTFFLSALWCLWLNRNEVVFRSLGRNISSVFHNNLSLTACWEDITLVGQRPDQASIPSSLRQMKTDWDDAIFLENGQSRPKMVTGNGTFLTKIKKTFLWN